MNNTDFASNTNDLPKTDFGAMRVLAAELTDRRFVYSLPMLAGSGTDAGIMMMTMCEQTESRMADVNFNAFHEADVIGSSLTRWFEDMVMTLCTVYLMRAKLRAADTNVSPELFYKQIAEAKEEVKGLLGGLVSLAEMKDREYGASWCKRGGIGAWFTTVRKFDRLMTQVKQKGGNLWDVSEPVASTESLEETIKDGINYLMLILEKRSTILSKNMESVE